MEMEHVLVPGRLRQPDPGQALEERLEHFLHLDPGQRKRVTFTLPVELLAYYDAAMQLAVEPVTVQVMVGNSSRNLPARGVCTLSGAKRVLGLRTHYVCPVEVIPG